MDPHREFTYQELYNGSIVQRHSFDAGYVERLRNGDQDTERHFVSYFGELMSLKLRSRVRSASIIEDVKQETFLRVLAALRQKGGLLNAGALGSFVNSVCNNVLFEVYRAESRIAAAPEGEGVSGQADAETVLVSEEEKSLVRDVLSAMPEKDSCILRWLFFEERDKNDVCRQLRVDREYLRVLLHRAKLRFRLDYIKRDSARSGPGATERLSASPKS